MIATNIQLPQRFDASMNTVDRLHPSRAGYDLNESPLSSASMTLSAETAEQGQFVRMFDTYGAVDVFRVAKVRTKYAKGQREQDVTLEHALATLGDVLIRGYYEYGGTGVTTSQVLSTLLALQTTTYWVLGACDYTDEYQYSVENESLLNTILSVASPLTIPYRWTFDTTTFPFTLNLVQATSTPTLEFRMNRNIQSVSHTVDRRDLRTRLYPLGYGEGVNQLTIADVNSGVEYIEANTDTYGVISDTFVDTSITDPQTLMDTAQAYLGVVSEPSVLTEVDGIDVFLRTGEPLDAPRLGAVASVPIAELGIDLTERVIRVVKNDIYGAPHKVKVTLTNQKRDSVRETASLLRKSRIGDLYSQGSTSFVPLHFADNADADDALVCDFYIDASEIYINQVLCKYKLDAFRAFSKSAYNGGPSQVSGGTGGMVGEGGYVYTGFPPIAYNTGAASGNTGSTTPGEGGLGATVTTTETGSTGAASGTTGDNNSNTGEASGSTGSSSGSTGSTTPGEGGLGATVTTTDTGSTGASSASTTSSSPGTSSDGTGSTGSASPDVVGVSGSTDGSVGSHAHTSGSYTVASHSHSGPSHSHTVNSHTHGLNAHTHDMTHYHGVNAHAHTGAAHTHSLNSHTHSLNAHTHTLGNHAHSLNNHTHDMTHYHGVNAHYHTGAAHTHSLNSHVHSMPDHTHSMNIDHMHFVTITTGLGHSHSIVYGIYKGTTANSVTVSVDGNVVDAGDIVNNQFDAVPYLDKDAGGKITRNAWHTISFLPDQNTRIICDIQKKTFIRAISGGNY